MLTTWFRVFDVSGLFWVWFALSNCCAQIAASQRQCVLVQPLISIGHAFKVNLVDTWHSFLPQPCLNSSTWQLTPYRGDFISHDTAAHCLWAWMSTELLDTLLSQMWALQLMLCTLRKCDRWEMKTSPMLHLIKIQDFCHFETEWFLKAVRFTMLERGNVLWQQITIISSLIGI